MPVPHRDATTTVEHQLRNGSWIPTPTPRQVLVASIRVRNRIEAMLAAETADQDKTA